MTRFVSTKLLSVLALLVAGFSFPAKADVMEIWNHSLDGGSVENNIKQYDRLKPILERLGARVEYYAQDIQGSAISSFVVRLQDMKSWGQYRDRLIADPEFAKWNSRHRPRANGLQVQTLMAENVFKPNAPVTLTDGQNVFYYTAWKALPGKTNQLYADIRASFDIIEAQGGTANLYRDGFSDTLHVFWAFSNWAEGSAFYENILASAEWQKFWARIAQNPSGAFITQSWVMKVPSLLD